MIVETDSKVRSQFRGKSRGPILSVMFRMSYLERVLVALWVVARAVAVAVDLEVGHLGDGNPREGGVHVNAEKALELDSTLRQLL